MAIGAYCARSAAKKKRFAENDAAVRNHGEDTARSQIAAVSGTERYESRDPVYHLSNQFTQNFDAVGKHINAQRHTAQEGENAERQGETGIASREKMTAQELKQRHDSPVYSHSRDQLENGDFCDRFASHAFTNGTLASSVMAGKSKEIFTSCFRRSLSQPLPLGEKQQKILGGASVQMPLANQPAKVVFNQDARSAVGIVLDTIRSSVRTLDIFKELVNGNSQQTQTPLQRRQIQTMSELYPFLKEDNGKQLIEQYKAQLKAMEGDSSQQGVEKRKTLESALKKATAVQERKVSEQRKFLTKITQIQENARRAEKIFSADDFADVFTEENFGLESENPPDDNPNKKRRRRRSLEDEIETGIMEALFGSTEAETDGGEFEPDDSFGSEEKTTDRKEDRREEKRS